MINIDFTFIIIIIIIIISLKKRDNNIIWENEMRLLFIYIINHDYDYISLIINSINIHLYWINIDFIYINQYYSCNIKIIYYFILELLKILYIHGLFLYKLFYNIPSWFIVIL